ncbi:hypothetical protein C0995_012803 [Termitomyces sp. Mi166|nr:hypothetical protein C0995_012803 [Termitomyces sp. Mi166\
MLWKAGRLEEAEDLEQQVLKAQIEAFGTNHPDTIDATANLAVTLRNAERKEVNWPQFKNTNVIKVDTDYTFCNQVIEDIIYHCLEGGQAISELKEHYKRFKESVPQWASSLVK